MCRKRGFYDFCSMGTAIQEHGGYHQRKDRTSETGSKNGTGLTAEGIRLQDIDFKVNVHRLHENSR